MLTSPSCERAARVDVAPEHKEVEGAVAPDVMAEADRAEAPARAHAEIDVARAEACGRRRDPDIGRPGKCGAAADAPALHGGDDRLREALDPLDEAAADLAPALGAALVALVLGLEVGARAERARARTADHDDARGLPPFQLVEGRRDRLKERKGQKVERRAVEDEIRDRVSMVDDEPGRS